MKNFLEIMGLIWLILMSISVFLLIVGLLIEKNLTDNNPIKKWWRRNIIDIDPYDDDWKNFNV